MGASSYYGVCVDDCVFHVVGGCVFTNHIGSDQINAKKDFFV
jgi:hypothetical protein